MFASVMKTVSVKSVLGLLLLILAGLCPVVRAEPESQDMIVFLFLAFFIGAIITYVLSRFAPDLPYTVVVFAVGAVLTVAFQPINDSDLLKESMLMWDHIEPELILFMFLPALLFGEAMMLNFHHVRGAVGPAAVLAGPGALFGAFIMAAAAKFTLPYDWSWSLCLVFGTILCATDPVAVVALLKKAGASNKLTYLIIGEALMNDGTALVLYNLLYGLIEKDGPGGFTVMDVLVYFIRVIFISPLLGGAFGVASVACLSLANRRMKEEDTTIQMAITICCAYLSFFVAERVLHVSGVLSCCSAALVLSRFAVPLFLRPETIHSIWAAFEWIGNTLIFILAGIIIGRRAEKYLGPTDAGYIFLVYVYMFVFRGLMMTVCFPALSWPRLGKVSSINDALFATWGGLRGAVSMALALSLVSSTENGDTTISNDDSHRVFFLVGGVAALTLLINATSSGFVLDRLKLLDVTNTLETRIMFHYVKKRIRLKAIHLLEQLQKSRPGSINPFLVAKYCSILASPGDAAIETLAMQDVGMMQAALIASSGPDAPIMASSSSASGVTSGADRHDTVSDVLSPGPSTRYHGGKAGIRFSVIDNSYQPMQANSIAAAAAAATAAAAAEAAAATQSASGSGLSIETPKHHADLMAASSTPGGDHSAVDAAFNISHEADKIELGRMSRDMSVMGLARDTSGLGLDRLAESPVPPGSTATTATAGASGGHHDIEVEVEGGGHVMPDHFARPEIMNDLLTHIRRAFLEVVRVSYWRQINAGKLPRKSSAALILLNSIDVALETTDTPGLQDWDEIESHYRALWSSQSNAREESISEAAAHGATVAAEGSVHAAGSHRSEGMVRNMRRRSSSKGNMGGRDSFGAYSSIYDDMDRSTMIAKSLKDYREAQVVYLLTTFIDAHQYAQKRIPYYLGDTETIDTPEEALVVQESKEIVNRARARLRAINPEIITLQVSKQTARWILHMQEDQIEEFLHEGVITQRDAETLFHEVEHDFKVLGKVEWVHILLSKISHRFKQAVFLRWQEWCPSGGGDGASGGGAGAAGRRNSTASSVRTDDDGFDCEYVQVQ